MITGSPAPNCIRFPRMGKSCNSVLTAETTSADWIRITRSAWASPAVFATMMAGVTQPTIMATTCWSAREKPWPMGGIPSSRNSVS